MKKVLLGALLTLATLNAVAQEESDKTGFYLGFGSTGTAFEIDDNEEAGVGSLSLKMGYKINDNFAIEGRYIGKSDDDNVHGVDLRLDSAQALYMRVSMGNPTFDPYILVGYARIEATATACNNSYCYSASAQESGGAFGFGANWNINETLSITGDWTLPAEDVVQFNIGLDFKF